MTGVIDRVYHALVDEDEDHGCGDLPESSCRAVPENAGRFVGALTLTKLGDRIADPRTVLTWLLESGGASASLTGMLVPVRESGSLLPQAALVPLVRRFSRRNRVWVGGSAAQAVAVAGMAVAAATAAGITLGVVVLIALALFALSRSLASISSKDVLAKTVPSGQRGQVLGWAGSSSGVVVIVTGLGLGLLAGDRSDGTLIAWLLTLAAFAWVAAAGLLATVREHAGEEDRSAGVEAIASAMGLLRIDRAFRRFVIARTLLFVTALSPPFLVIMANRREGSSLADLGVFVAVSGGASLLGSPLWGRLADRSSRWAMGAASASGTITVVAFLGLAAVTPVGLVAHAAAYFLLMLAHAGARVGRKTYVVELGEGNRRTDYVAVSNTVIGVLLLVVGGATSALATVRPELALAFLAIVGAAGAVVAASLPET